MSTGCPNCHCTDVVRKRRKGILDRIQARLGRWPFRCLNCGILFRGRRRHPEKTAEYCSQPVRPYAKIVIEADTYAHLDAMLLAFSRAASIYSNRYAQSGRS